MISNRLVLAGTALLAIWTVAVCRVQQSSSSTSTDSNFPRALAAGATTEYNGDDLDQSIRMPISILSEDELEQMLENIRGEDYRLVRWNASPHTARQRHQGACKEGLPQASQVLMSPEASHHAKQLAAEYLTFCITDAPVQRHVWSQQTGIHEAVVELLASTEHAKLSASAAHLIYITTFANSVNHQAFMRSGAVQALAQIVINKRAAPIQRMWASAALQNLANSYCQTEIDGRCYWEWTPESPHLQITEESLPLLSDGSKARQTMLVVPGLVQALTELTCQRPSQGKASDDNIFPGENALSPRDDYNPRIMTWAASGALKNIALEPSGQQLLDAAMPCQCQLRFSSDWLESSNSHDFIHYTRRGKDPCWFDKQTGNLCVDNNFLDDEQYTCYAYKGATDEDCEARDEVTGDFTANEACCGCGGGTVHVDKPQADLF